MAPLVQITFGGLLLILCTVVHIVSFTTIIRKFRHWEKRPDHWIMTSDFRRIVFVLLVLLVSHTTQVYIWAATFWLGGMLESIETSIYYALVSYTTLGYGDVTLGPPFRIYGAMSSVVGVFTIGMSTAFLVGFFAELLAASEQDRP
ncbi:MAG: ion channel [Arenibacterium sp.]